MRPTTVGRSQTLALASAPQRDFIRRAGADIFTSAHALDSGAGRLRGLITDCVTSAAHIDLSQLDANSLAVGQHHFTWIDAAAFHGMAGETLSPRMLIKKPLAGIEFFIEPRRQLDLFATG